MWWWVVIPWATTTPSRAEPADSTPALVDQELLPALEARRLTALARIDARERFVQGKASFDEAWPRIDAVTLGRPEVLRGRVALLDDAAVTRIREATVPTPDGLDARTSARLKDTRDAALRAEGRADELERALLVAVIARLQDHPELTRERVAPLRAPFESVLAEPPPQGTDEADIAALQARARADVERQRLEALLLALRVGAIGTPVPSPEEDLARLGTPDEARAAADRLGLLRTFLDDEAGARVSEALVAWWSSTPLQEAQQRKATAEAALQQGPPPLPEDQAHAGVQAAQEGLDAAKATLAATPTGTPLGDAVAAVRQAEVDAAAAELALAEARLRGVQSKVATAEDVERARTQAQIAQEEADAARAAAADARDRRRADVLSDYASAQVRAAATAEGASQAQARLDALEAAVVDPEAELERKVEKVRELSKLDPDRPEPDEVYTEVRQLLLKLRDNPALFGSEVLAAEAARDEVITAVTRDRQRMVEARALLDDMSGEAFDRFQDTLGSWATVLDATEDAADARVRVAHQERDLALSTLSRARLARRSVQGYVSREQRDRDTAWFFADVWQEVSLLPPTVWLKLRERVSTLRGLPLQLTDFNVVRGLLGSSFWAIVSGLAWWWGRNQSGAWSLMLAERVRRVFPELRPTDLRALRDPTARFLRNSVDLLLGPLLLWALGETLPELRFLVGVYLYLALYRALAAGFDLAVVKSSEARPALLVLRPETYDLARSTLQWFVGWFLMRRFVDYLLWEVLGLDRVSETVDGLLRISFWLLCAGALFRWEPIMRERVVRGGSEGRVVRWLTKADNSVLLRIPRAIGQLGLLAASGVLELSHRFAREGNSLAWLFNTVSRYRLSEEDETHTAIEESIRARILETTDLRKRIERPELGGLGDALTEWEAEHRRGLVALVGDRGAGKGVACDEMEEMLRDAGLEVVRARLDTPLRTGDRVLDWLAQVVGLEPGARTAEQLVDEIEASPRRAFLLEDVHRCFSRRVGGIEAVNRLLYVLNATCDHHFWVVTVHGPAWDYFASVGSLVDTGVFHSIIRLAPLSSQQLRELTVTRTGRAGFRVDFSGLARRSALVGGDREVEQERAVGLFYRLLADASNGSPVVALALFARCLERTEDERVLRVFLGPALSLGVKADLADPALFVLVALNLHGELDEAELVEVTNLSEAVVRATVRNLVSRGILERRDHVVRVPDELVPLVQRTLRRRHFLHLGGA
ncbi:MAG: hypothetical protein H6735_29810 [Alphaproteobacteria bacterium]|nr:hypothetical protein [Alphaproteobacteria bacterium]